MPFALLYVCCPAWVTCYVGVLPLLSFAWLDCSLSMLSFGLCRSLPFSIARPGQWRGHAWHARISHAQRAHHLKTGVCPMCLFRHSCCPAWATKSLCEISVCVDCTRLCWHSFYFHASSAAQWVRLSFYGVTLWLSFGRRRSLRPIGLPWAVTMFQGTLFCFRDSLLLAVRLYGTLALFMMFLFFCSPWECALGDGC